MNNLELVEYAKKCLNLGNNSVYVYGSFGNKLTTSFCDSKQRQYPDVNTVSRTVGYKKLCDGKHYGFDCVGLIKSFYWGGYGQTSYNSSTDVSADGMYYKARVKGNMSTMDKSRKGLLVQMDGHIGIYIGNNEVIECTIATQFAKQNHGLGGVCKTKLSDRNWLHWLECPYIDYVKENTTSPTTTSSTKGILTVASGSWNVRKGAGTNYGVVKVVNGGTKLEYTAIENGWYKLNDGYISSKAVSTTETSPGTKGIIEVENGTWNVRKGAGTNYGIVRVVKGGTKLEYTAIENGWYKLSDGYISSKAVTGNTTTLETTKTTTGDVYLRSTEAYGNNIICVIPKGSTVVYYSGTGWAKVKYNGITGYCGYKYLK